MGDFGIIGDALLEQSHLDPAHRQQVERFGVALRIDFRNPVTQELLASGQSYRTSLDRKPAKFMVDEIITALFEPGESP